MKILVINGPNINMLGIREPDIYGKKKYTDLIEHIEYFCAEHCVEVSFFQSNHEGDIVDTIQEAYGIYQGIIINPAAYTHTSIAIYDALKAVAIPAVEVHLSDVESREEFRRISYITPACIAKISGKGFEGYCEAVVMLCTLAEKEN